MMSWGWHPAWGSWLNSDQLSPQGNTGLVGRLSNSISNLSILRHWTFEINRPRTCLTNHSDYKQDQGLPFWEQRGLYTLLFMPWNHPISLLKKGHFAIQRGRQALTMELLKATEGCEILTAPHRSLSRVALIGTRALWLLREAGTLLALIAAVLVPSGWEGQAPVLGPLFTVWVQLLGVSSRLAARKESGYCISHTLARSWLGDARLGWS